MTLVLAALGLAAAAEPAPIRDYAALMDALTRGVEVRAVIRYGQCLLNSEPGPDVIGGMSFDVFELFPKLSIGNPVGFVSTSATQLILHPRYGHVLNYARLKVYEDGRAEVTARYLDPRKYKVVMDETFGCAFAQQGGITLFEGA